jgi:protein tyrosine phosphatase (PTP) superfamily phosphohydrolase (DUF442 family)
MIESWKLQHAVAAVLFAMMGVAGCLTVQGNFRCVEPNAFYRSAQMPAGRLERVIARYGIQTVINLRGASPEEDWYIEEVTACAENGVQHHSLAWTMQRIPEPESLAHFVHLVETCPSPILVHCQGGTHRTGVASACYLMLEGGALDDARRQLGLFFGDAPIGELLDLYEGSSKPFAQWVREDYPQCYEAWEQAAAERQDDLEPGIARDPLAALP